MGRFKDGSDITEGSEGKEGSEGSESFEVCPHVTDFVMRKDSTIQPQPGPWDTGYDLFRSGSVKDPGQVFSF